jgi:hypothetical protein
MDRDAAVGTRGSVEVESARRVGDVQVVVEAVAVRVWRAK